MKNRKSQLRDRVKKINGWKNGGNTRVEGKRKVEANKELSRIGEKGEWVRQVGIQKVRIKKGKEITAYWSEKRGKNGVSKGDQAKIEPIYKQTRSLVIQFHDVVSSSLKK